MEPRPAAARSAQPRQRCCWLLPQDGGADCTVSLPPSSLFILLSNPRHHARFADSRFTAIRNGSAQTMSKQYCNIRALFLQKSTVPECGLMMEQQLTAFSYLLYAWWLNRMLGILINTIWCKGKKMHSDTYCYSTKSSFDRVPRIQSSV